MRCSVLPQKDTLCGNLAFRALLGKAGGKGGRHISLHAVASALPSQYDKISVKFGSTQAYSSLMRSDYFWLRKKEPISL